MNSPNVILVTREVETIARLFYISVLTVSAIGVVNAVVVLVRGLKKWENPKEKIAESIDIRTLTTW